MAAIRIEPFFRDPAPEAQPLQRVTVGAHPPVFVCRTIDGARWIYVDDAFQGHLVLTLRDAVAEALRARGVDPDSLLANWRP